MWLKEQMLFCKQNYDRITYIGFLHMLVSYKRWCYMISSYQVEFILLLLYLTYILHVIYILRAAFHCTLCFKSKWLTKVWFTDVLCWFDRDSQSFLFFFASGVFSWKSCRFATVVLPGTVPGVFDNGLFIASSGGGGVWSVANRKLN